MQKKHKRCLIAALIFLVAYLGILVAPGLMGSVVDEAQGSFAGGVTAVGGKALRARARQTIQWAQHAATNGGMAGIRICEIGPGRGILAQEASRTGNKYCAIDMDEAAIERVKPYSCWSFCGRVPPMPDEMPTVNAFVCENVLEHSESYAEAKALLIAFRQKLATTPKGVLVLRCPDINQLKFGFWDAAQDHQYVTSLRRITMLCRECGFEIDRCGLAFDHLTGWQGWLAYRVKRLWPWQTMHNLFYESWKTSPWSKLAEKTLHCYVVAVK